MQIDLTAILNHEGKTEEYSVPPPTWNWISSAPAGSLFRYWKKNR